MSVGSAESTCADSGVTRGRDSLVDHPKTQPYSAWRYVVQQHPHFPRKTSRVHVSIGSIDHQAVCGMPAINGSSQRLPVKQAPADEVCSHCRRRLVEAHANMHHILASLSLARGQSS